MLGPACGLIRGERVCCASGASIHRQYKCRVMQEIHDLGSLLGVTQLAFPSKCGVPPDVQALVIVGCNAPQSVVQRR